MAAFAMPWETFYVIVGSAAAALTGLMFVAIALISDFGADFQPQEQVIDAFATPDEFVKILRQAGFDAIAPIRLTFGSVILYVAQKGLGAGD